MHELKLPSKIKLSYLDDSESILLERESRCGSILLCLVLQEQFNSHFLFRKFNSKQKLSISLSSVETTFAGMSFLMKSVIPPPSLFRSRRNGVPKPSKKNWPSGKVSLL